MAMNPNDRNAMGTILGRAMPFAALIGAMIALVIGTSLGKTLFPHVGAVGTAAYRVGFSAFFLIAIWRPWRRRYGGADWRQLVIFGASLGMMNLCFYLSLRTIPLGIAVATEFMGPLGVALWMARRGSDLAWLALTITGLALMLPIEGAGSRLDPEGMAFAAAAGVFWALYIIYGARLAHLHSGHAIAIAMGIAALLVVPIGLGTAGEPMLRPEYILVGLIVAAVSSAIPYSLEMVALRHIPPRIFGTFTSIEPAVGALGGFLFLQEALSARQMLAISCVIAASCGTALMARRPADPVVPELPPA